MGGASTNTADMQRAAKDFYDTCQTIDGYMTGLRTHLDNLRSRWLGQAFDTFQSTMDQWGKHFDKILKDLDNMCDLLDKGSGQYKHTEEKAIHHGHFFSPVLTGVPAK